jgi:hypothetical protein
VIRRTFPSKSPTVGFIWTMAMRKVRIEVRKSYQRSAISQKKRPLILARTEDVIVRDLVEFDRETPLSPKRAAEDNTPSMECQTFSRGQG